jgi:hypothetical protein
MARKEENAGLRLHVPLDAGGIEGVSPSQPVKVVARDGAGRLQSKTVRLDAQGQGSASFEFAEDPGAVQLYVGPADAADEDFPGLQTIRFSISRRQWAGQPQLKLPPVRIAPYFWHLWLRWCREFVVRGRVLCPDGSPVPGAQVCAYDVDWWWWWLSRQQLGCATTDATGAFELRFRWCCGWLPWWWLKQRTWQLEPALVDHVTNVLQLDPTLPRLAKPAAQPAVAPLELLLGDRPGRARSSRAQLDVARIASLRDELLQRLPRSPELERLRVWPWWPWQPWSDCTPDLIFRVTQQCGGGLVTIVDERFSDARWNVPTRLDVTLTANAAACCADPEPDPPGNCLDVESICGFDPSDVAGNLSAPAAPLGYANPGEVAAFGDRPFAGAVTLTGKFGTLANADYYELEWLDGATWVPAPPETVAGFARTYYGPALPAGAIDTYTVPFPVALIDGHHVIESRQHFEATNGAGSWEIVAPGSRWWHANRNTLLSILTAGTLFAEGTFRFRVKSWRRVGNTLVDPQVLPHCGTDPAQPNRVVVTTDNRHVGAGPLDSHGKPCGAIHFCTTEPDTDIVAVSIVRPDGTQAPVTACGNVQIGAADVLRVDFLAHDPDGHLADYVLRLTFGENEYVDLVWTTSGLVQTDLLGTEPSASLVALAAAQVGPHYGHALAARSALAQGATSPHWSGGRYRFEVLASRAFPRTCCYQLVLTADKRTVADCSAHHWNTSELSFLVNV